MKERICVYMSESLNTRYFSDDLDYDVFRELAQNSPVTIYTIPFFEFIELYC